MVIDWPEVRWPEIGRQGSKSRCSQLGSYTLPDGVLLVTAMNGGTDQYTTPLCEALRQRMVHLYVHQPGAAGWDQWAREADVPEIVRAFGGASWSELVVEPEWEDLAGDYSSYTRCLEHLGRLEVALSACREPMIDLLPALFQGLLGAAKSADYRAHRDTFGKLPSVESILADPDGISLPDDRQLTYAVARRVVEPRDGYRNGSLEPACRFLARLPGEIAEWAYRQLGERYNGVWTTSAYCEWQRQQDR